MTTAIVDVQEAEAQLAMAQATRDELESSARGARERVQELAGRAGPSDLEALEAAEHAAEQAERRLALARVDVDRARAEFDAAQARERADALDLNRQRAAAARDRARIRFEELRVALGEILTLDAEARRLGSRAHPSAPPAAALQAVERWLGLKQ